MKLFRRKKAKPEPAALIAAMMADLEVQAEIDAFETCIGLK